MTSIEGVQHWLPQKNLVEITSLNNVVRSYTYGETQRVYSNFWTFPCDGCGTFLPGTHCCRFQQVLSEAMARKQQRGGSFEFV